MRNSAQASIVAGWWRASEYSNTLYRCEYSGACKQGRCTEGHKGPACRVCEKGFAYDALENKCTKCSGDILYTVLVFLGVVLVLALVGAVIARKHPELFEMVAKDAARGTVEQEEDGEDEDASHKWFRLVKSKLKIVLGVSLGCAGIKHRRLGRDGADAGVPRVYNKTLRERCFN